MAEGPQEMGNCLRNIVAPSIRDLQPAIEICESLPDDEYRQCRKIVEKELYSKIGTECLKRMDELKPFQCIFVSAYVSNEFANNRYEKIPANIRDCLDSMKPLAQSNYQSAKDCDALKDDDSTEGNKSPETRNPYAVCMNKVEHTFGGRPLPDKCVENAEMFIGEQERHLEPYLLKIVFNL